MLIIGAGGHAKEILDLLDKNKDIDNLCFYDDTDTHSDFLLYDKFRILKSEEEVIKYFNTVDNRFNLGIGHPQIREKLYKKFQNLGGNFASIISNQSYIGNYDVLLEEGVTVASQTSINNSVKISKGSLINRRVSIAHDCIIGQFVEISPHVAISGHCIIGDKTFIGTGSIIIPKITIGSNVIVAAGAVVTNNVPDNKMVAGIPAVVKKTI